MMDPFSDMSDNEFFNNMSHSTLSKSVNNLNNTFFKFNIENLESQPVTALICSLITWSTLYFITVALLDRSPEFCTRVVTLIHGLLTTGMGSYICKMKMENKIEDISIPPSLVIINSWGYFTFDLIWCLWYQTETKLMIVHHIYSVYALARMLYLKPWITTACCGLGAMEFTNPLLQARWFIRSLGFMRTKVYSMVEVMFMTTFILIRGVGGTVYVLYILCSDHMILEVKIVIIIIYVLSCMFMLNMYKYVKAHYVVAINGMESRSPSELGCTESEGIVLPNSS